MIIQLSNIYLSHTITFRESFNTLLQKNSTITSNIYKKKFLDTRLVKFLGSLVTKPPPLLKNKVVCYWWKIPKKNIRIWTKNGSTLMSTVGIFRTTAVTEKLVSDLMEMEK